MTAITALHVRLGMDVSDFSQGANLAKAETNRVAAIMRQSQPAAEKYQKDLELLNRAFSEAGKQGKDYANALEFLRKKYNQVDESQESMLDRLSKLGNVSQLARNALDLVSAGVGFVLDKFDMLSDQLAGIDDLQKAAAKLGVSFNELGALQFAAGEIGGGNAVAALEKGLEQMMKRGLVQPGETAVDAFKRVADQFQGMSNQSDKMKLAFDTFGKAGADLVGVLQEGSDVIENSVQFFEQTNGLTREQTMAAEEFGDLWNRVTVAAEGFKNIVAVELAPAFSLIAESLLGMQGTVSSLRQEIRGMIDNMMVLGGQTLDAGKKAAASMLPGGSFLQMFFGDENTGMQAFAALKQKRDALEQASLEQRIAQQRKADEEKFLSDKQAVKEIEEDYSKLIDGNAAAWDQFIDERKRRNKQVTEAIAAAEKELDRQRQQREKMRADIAKGPASMEVGSQEYARYLADQINQAMADSVLGADTKPTEDQLLDEAVRQTELIEKTTAQNEERHKQLADLIAATKENGFKRIR